MIARLGWVVVACAGASLARAEQPKPRKPPTDPLHLDTGASRTEVPKPKKKTVDEELAELTADPHLGKADRIRGEELKGMVTFTFDDGPEPATTPAVIDALLAYDVPATFFIVTRRIVGKHGEKRREILKRQLQSGFLIASHSVSHASLRGANAKKLAAEIDESIRTLANQAERPIGLFRAPFGAIDKHGRAWLKKRGLTEAFWSIDTLDWQAKDSTRLRKKVIAAILKQEGGVVLMHDVKPITAKVVAGILDDLEAENCKRLDAGGAPIWPVSIHYFIRDNKKPRAIPDDVKQETEAYQAALPKRCAARAKPAATTPAKPEASPAKPEASPAKPAPLVPSAPAK